MTDESIPTTSESPVACTLSGAEFGDRVALLGEYLVRELREVRELPDGYALRYEAERPIAERLLGVIAAERECCPFFTFELVFAPDRGPLWLRLRGPEGTKEVIRALIPV